MSVSVIGNQLTDISGHGIDLNVYNFNISNNTLTNCGTGNVSNFYLTSVVSKKGFVGEKLDASYQNRILAQDVNRLVEPFRNRTEDRCWQSEFWGKWFTSAVSAYRYRLEPQFK